MFRFFALFWSCRDAEAASDVNAAMNRLLAAKPDMKMLLEAKGLLVMAAHVASATEDVHLLARSTGVILGPIFSRSGTIARKDENLTFGEAESTEIVSTGGRCLVDNYWGRYVALILNEVEQEGYALHSPLGFLPCYTTNWKSIRLVFSHVEDCVAFPLLRLSIDWRYVIAFTLYPRLHPMASGIQNVTRIQAGECIRVSGGLGLDRRMYWTPLTFAVDPIENSEEAVRLIRVTASSCVNAWAARYRRVLLKVSGGLDSAIVLVCLQEADARPFITCLNYHDKTGYGDERRFFRLVTEILDKGRSEVIECERSPSSISFGDLQSVRPTVDPMIYGVALAFRGVDQQFAKFGEALFGGMYGDQMFLRETAFAAIDQAWRHPIGRKFACVALNEARSREASFWEIARGAILYGSLRRPMASWVYASRPFMTRHAVDSVVPVAQEYLMPFLRGPEVANIPPGKLAHVELMSGPVDGFSPFDQPNDLPRRNPLMSQPLAEIFARIPVEMLTEGGRNRGLVRRAFSKDLPSELVARESKSLPSEFFYKVYKQNESIVKDFLFQGELVRQGIVDQSQMEGFLAGSFEANSPAFSCLVFEYMSVEVWLQSLRGFLSRAGHGVPVDAGT